jgi:GT2 family glycosyltransferase
MNTFFIGIPTINQAELLNESIKKYEQDFPTIDIFIIDNGQQEIKFNSLNVSVIENSWNIGVAPSWNWFMRTGEELGYTHGLILNDDVYLGKNENEVFDFINGEKKEFGFIKSHHHWCAFFLNISTFKKIGHFDEGFYPAYFEDNDYMRRMKLGGVKTLQTDFLDPLIYNNSLSIKKDRSLNENFARNQQRYIEKWGGLPNVETFKTPFNN